MWLILLSFALFYHLALRHTLSFSKCRIKHTKIILRIFLILFFLFRFRYYQGIAQFLTECKELKSPQQTQHCRLNLWPIIEEVWFISFCLKPILTSPLSLHSSFEGSISSTNIFMYANIVWDFRCTSYMEEQRDTIKKYIN